MACCMYHRSCALLRCNGTESCQNSACEGAGYRWVWWHLRAGGAVIQLLGEPLLFVSLHSTHYQPLVVVIVLVVLVLVPLIFDRELLN